MLSPTKCSIVVNGNPEIKRSYDKFKQRTIYIYEIEHLFKNNENNSLEFSANTIKIGFIDVDKILKTIAAETSDFTMQLIKELAQKY